MAGFRFASYNVQKHAKQARKLIDHYLLPTYYQRMGIKAEESSKYIDVEDILDPQSIMDPRYEQTSKVAFNQSGDMVGLHLSYFVDKPSWQKEFIDASREYFEDKSLKESVRKYCKHRYEVCEGLDDLYDRYQVEKFIYFESTIVHPDYRRMGISLANQKKAYEEFGTKYGILTESQTPKYLVDTGKIKTLEQTVPGVDGFVILKDIRSYDDFIVVVAFRPPLPKLEGNV